MEIDEERVQKEFETLSTRVEVFQKTINELKTFEGLSNDEMLNNCISKLNESKEDLDNFLEFYADILF